MHMDGHQFLEAQVNMMCKADREALLALHDCESVGVPTLRGIMSTNAMHVGSLPGYDARCSAVCRDISRVNHRYATASLSLRAITYCRLKCAFVRRQLLPKRLRALGPPELRIRAARLRTHTAR